MRATGITTRQVDQAIQTLFTKKEIYFPNSNSQIEDLYRNKNLKGMRLDFDQYIIDHSVLEFLAHKEIRVLEIQKYIFKRIIGRLKMEHEGLELEVNKYKRIKIIE